ncbi:MAG: ATP synthase F1 subunit delta [Candidatus Acidiferrales bacterium]
MNEAVARRYASALADVALEQIKADRVKADFTAFVETFYSSADLRNCLETPAIGPEQKNRVIEAISEKREYDPAVRNFIYAIVDHRRTELLREIEKAFGEELNARLGIAQAEVTSARPLNSAQRVQLTAVLERRTKKKIEATFQEDKSLLGGAVVRIGSTVYDGSVREQLNRLRQQLETE